MKEIEELKAKDYDKEMNIKMKQMIAAHKKRRSRKIRNTTSIIKKRIRSR